MCDIYQQLNLIQFSCHLNEYLWHYKENKSHLLQRLSEVYLEHGQTSKVEFYLENS